MTLTRRRSRGRGVELIVLALFGVALDLAYALILAIPVMFLTDALVDWGWTAITPLGYWQSWWAAFLISWIVDGSGLVRRAMKDAE